MSGSGESLVAMVLGSFVTKSAYVCIWKHAKVL